METVEMRKLNGGTIDWMKNKWKEWFNKVDTLDDSNSDKFNQDADKLINEIHASYKHQS